MSMRMTLTCPCNCVLVIMLMMVMMMTMMTMTAPNNENDMPRSPPLLCRHPHPCSQTSKTPTTHDNDDDHDDHHYHDEGGKEEVSILWRVFLNLIKTLMLCDNEGFPVFLLFVVGVFLTWLAHLASLTSVIFPRKSSFHKPR